MSISLQTARSQFTLSSKPETLTIPWYFLASGDLKVVRTRSGVDTDATLSTHYTVAGAGNEAGGSVTVLNHAFWTVGDTVTVHRSAQLVQPADYPLNGQFPSATAEASADRMTMLLQQLQLGLERSIRVPATNAALAELTKTGRANKVLTFDTNGDVSLAAIDPTGTGATNNLVLAAGSTTARTLGVRFGEVVNVKDYGAAGDGVTNDTTAIQAAVNAAGNKALYFPAGRYLVSSAVVFPSGSSAVRKVYGDGPAASYIYTESNISMFSVNLNADLYYTEFSDLGFIGNVSGTRTSNFAISLTGSGSFYCNHNLFTRLLFLGVYRGIYVDKDSSLGGNEAGFDWNIFSHLQSTNYGANQVRDVVYFLNGSGTGNVFSTCSLVFSNYGLYFGGANGDNIGDLIFDACHFGGTSAAGVFLSPAGAYRERVIVSDCQADAGVTRLLDAEGYNLVVLDGNSYGGAVEPNNLTGARGVWAVGEYASRQIHGRPVTLQPATPVNVFLAVLPAYSGAVVDIEASGLCQGVGAGVHRQRFLLVAGAATVTVTALTASAAGAGTFTVATAVSGFEVTFSIDSNASLANSEINTAAVTESYDLVLKPI